MSFAAAIHTPVKKSLCRLPENTETRIARAMLALEEDPRPSGVVKLSGREGWRIRIGDYRAVYSIDDMKKEIVVLAIGHRREIYC